MSFIIISIATFCYVGGLYYLINQMQEEEQEILRKLDKESRNNLEIELKI